MTLRPEVTDSSWLSGSERAWAHHLRLAVLVAAALVVTAPSPAQDGTYDPVPVAALEDRGAGPAPNGLPLETGADAPADTVTADDPNPDGEPPGPPSNPFPPHGATRVWIEVMLDWADTAGADSYDVYLGPDDPPPFVGNTSSSYWLPNQLDYDTTYYWQIVAKNASGSTPGPVWSFHTTVICRGDLNCDGFIDFGDINAFVLALSNWQAWLLKYPDCPPENADINGDKIFGGVVGISDIHAFVALLASAGGYPIPCQPPAGACQLANGACELKTEAGCTAAGGVWQGAGTVCAPNADLEPPGVPSNPYPPHGATGVPPEIGLNWSESPRADSYDVYFGTNDPPPFVGTAVTPAWSLSKLRRNTMYYWQIVAKNAYGSTPGPVWWFHTHPLLCLGDLNCDGFVDFGDINPYVLRLSHPAGYHQQYPDCPPENGQIGINAFVALLASAGGEPIPCD